MIGKAVISPCGTYRYTLSRPPRIVKPTAPTAAFCLLNPSTADADVNDATVRRMWGFSDAWGCNGFVVVNLFAIRSKDPGVLDDENVDRIGPENDRYLETIAAEYKKVICGWGNHGRDWRVQQVMRIFHKVGAETFCFGATKYGQPMHPLYIRSDQQLLPYIA